MSEPTRLERLAHRFHDCARAVNPTPYAKMGTGEQWRTIAAVIQRHRDLAEAFSEVGEDGIFYVLYTFPQTERLMQGAGAL